MAGPPSGFEAALANKYDIMRQETNARSNLYNTQAQVMPEQVAAENQLRLAQANLTGQEAGQVAPNAESARRLQGAQTGGEYARSTGQNISNQTNAALLRPIGAIGARALFNGLTGYNALANPTPAPGGSDVGGSGTLGNMQTVTYGANAPTDPFQRRDQMGRAPNADSAAPLFDSSVGTYKKGTSNVPAKGHARAAMANAQKGKGGGLAAILPALMAAGNGSAGGGTPMPGAMPPAPGGMPQAPGGAPGPMGFFGGTAQVPGKGSGNVDKVPAMLAPHEAVLTHGAADALGRGKIAALNAAHPPGKAPGKGLVKKRA